MYKLILLVHLIAVLQIVISGPIDSPLLKKLHEKGVANVIISFHGGTEAPLAQLQETTFVTREDRLNGVASILRAHAAKAQKEALKVLGEKGHTNYAVLWITNQIFIRKATLDIVKELADLPSVSEISDEFFIKLDDPIDQSFSLGRQERNVEWGLEAIRAPQCWQRNVTGRGIIVGNIDTGVRWTHEALIDNYVGAANYGWFDPWERTQHPNDNNGHGTHTMGTICGQYGIGVAPGATWLACKGCASFFCNNGDLLECGQFMLCPHDTNGNHSDCSKAPHLVSNSWGGGRGNNFYDGVISGWKAAGITPIFAQGNAGPTCNSANSPGDNFDAFGVGASDINNVLASFSSVGPSYYNGMKPNLAAPGANIRSAWIDSDNNYSTISGTSMACPHVAGVVALMKSHDITWTHDRINATFQYTATGPTNPTGRSCGAIPENVYPNHLVGSGLVNAYRAVFGGHWGLPDP